MSHDQRFRGRDGGPHTTTTRADAPGKRPLTRDLVQRKPAGEAASGSDLRRDAARGAETATAAMPHRAAIQASFGPRHDLSSVSAHVGGGADDACRAIGAEAYATGEHVVFRRTPDLHTAAHEAAHVIQQRSGVYLADGLGDSGDIYERRADEVADRVVAGRPAHDLLGGGGPPAAGSQIQRQAATCDDGADPAAAECSPDRESEAEALAAIADALPELAATTPGLRAYDRALATETRAHFRIPAEGWDDVRPADGRHRRMDLSSSLGELVTRIGRDPAALAHVRATLDLFYDDPDPRSRLQPGDIDLPLVLAIAARESGPRNMDLLLSSRDDRMISAGPDTHRSGRGGLDYVGGHRDEFPSGIRDHVTATQGTPRLEAGLVRPRANPAELRERDVLAAYIVELRAREERFESMLRRRADFLSREQVDELLAGLSRDARRAWIQASFGSRLPHLLDDVLGRMERTLREGTFAAVRADPRSNLNAIIEDDSVMNRAGLSGHRTRVSAADAAMAEATLPPELLAYRAASPDGATDAAAICAAAEDLVCE